ncbi:LPS export ABC transporter periplasmic protein LptC [Bacteroidia bacterium]|nr:LPS export ABC transporter periplasmic protein LptC [Bacteroidia bacterium]
MKYKLQYISETFFLVSIIRYSLSILVLLLFVLVLLSCRNDMNTIRELSDDWDRLPEMSGEDLILAYSDSALIKYKIITSEYSKVTRDDAKIDEFPRGMYVELYDKDEKIEVTIKSNYAHRRNIDNIWEARDKVVVVNQDGTKLETELLFWDMAGKRIYSPQYSRLTMKEKNIVEGHNGFESDQNLQHPVFGKVTGQIEYKVE